MSVIAIGTTYLAYLVYITKNYHNENCVKVVFLDNLKKKYRRMYNIPINVYIIVIAYVYIIVLYKLV